MIDRIYTILYRGIETLFQRSRIRRCIIVICLATPGILILWNPPWFLEAYFYLGAPFAVFGFGLVLVDMHLWAERRENKD